MKNINKNSISYVFPALFLVSILGLAVIPIKVSAQMPYYNYNGYIDLRKTDNAPSYNLTPAIVSVNPSSSNIGIGTKTVTIIGSGFVPGSIARVNGANRPTTFIDSSHLLMQVTGNDTYAYQSNGGFFITVFNGAPGGGYSNTAFFAVNNPASPASTTATANTVNDTTTNFIDSSIPNENVDSNNLAANAILALDGIYPSGIIQWILFAIMLFLVVILVRKIFGSREKYHATPLKHD